MTDSAAALGRAASRNILGRGILYTVGTAVPVLSMTAITPFATRTLGPGEYGVVASATVAIQVAMIVLGLGLAAAITRHGILEDSGLAGAGGLVRWGAAGSLGLAVVIALLSRPLASLTTLTGIESAQVISLIALCGACFAIVVNAQAYLRIQDRPLPFALLAAGASAGGPVVALLLAKTAAATAPVFLAGLTCGYAATAIVGLLLTARHGRGSGGDLRRGLRIGIPTIPHQVALYLAGGALVVVAGQLYGVDAAGRLQLAVLAGTAPAIITASLNNSWAPVVYRTAPADRASVLERSGRDITALTALAAGTVAMLAPLILAVLAPAQFSPTELTPAVGLTAIGSVFSPVYLANVHLVFSSGRSAGLALVSPLALLVGLGAAWELGASFGLAAVGAGMAVTYAALAGGVAVLARRVSATRWRELTLAPGLCGGVLVCLVGACLPVTEGWLIGRTVIAAVLIGLAAMALWRLLRSSGSPSH